MVKGIKNNEHSSIAISETRINEGSKSEMRKSIQKEKISLP